MPSDKELFELWFAQPLRKLEAMPGGQGGFIALATSCLLYERLAKAFLSSKSLKADTQALIMQLASDFSVDEPTATAFWSVIRSGLLHQAMPLQQKQKAPLPKWAFHPDYPLMALEQINGSPFLKVQPWKFMKRVLELWESNVALLSGSQSFPWATVGPVPA
jgi:hypothetical protein